MTLAHDMLRAPARAGDNSAEHLRSFVERIQRLNQERKDRADDVAEVYAEAKGMGFDKAALRRVVRILELDPAERVERQAIDELYLQALASIPPPRVT